MKRRYIALPCAGQCVVEIRAGRCGAAGKGSESGCSLLKTLRMVSFMDETKAISIVSALANGVNPLTGEVFPADSPYQTADVARALFLVPRLLDSRPKVRPKTIAADNAGKPWNADEDRRLLTRLTPATGIGDLARTMAGRQPASRHVWKSMDGLRRRHHLRAAIRMLADERGRPPVWGPLCEAIPCVDDCSGCDAQHARLTVDSTCQAIRPARPQHPRAGKVVGLPDRTARPGDSLPPLPRGPARSPP